MVAGKDFARLPVLVEKDELPVDSTGFAISMPDSSHNAISVP